MLWCFVIFYSSTQFVRFGGTFMMLLGDMILLKNFTLADDEYHMPSCQPAACPDAFTAQIVSEIIIGRVKLQ